MQEVWQEIGRLVAAEQGGALVTITRTTGSTYQREGAKMVCRPDGELVGSISGGCLESDVYEEALEAVEQGETRLVLYDTNAENDNVWGLGLGCNGTVEVLVEPLTWWRSSTGRSVFERVIERIKRGENSVLATVLQRDGERVRTVERILVSTSGEVIGTLGDPALEKEIADRAQKILSEETVRPSRRVTIGSPGSACDVFIDAVVPPLRLLVFGAGHDAIPLVEMAHALGMMVTVIDTREQFAVQRRFPWAVETVCIEPEEFGSRISLEGRPALVLMSHNYLKDKAVLEQVLSRGEEFTYIGALGPRVRTEQILNDLRGEGIKFRSEKVETIRTPIGLDLGADSPAEIALSVLAEIMAVKNRRSARPLREKKVAIHEAA